jgi:hypothetical protein
VNSSSRWLKKAPKWFQAFHENDFNHLKWKVDLMARIQWIILAAILGGAIAICLKVL